MSKQNIYKMSLEIDYKKQWLSSKGELKIYPNSETNILSFYLYKNFEIELIECDKKIKYYEEVNNDDSLLFYMPESKQINVYFEDVIIKNDSVKIVFKYKGYMKEIVKYEINRITEEWVELGIHSPWYPYSQNIDEVYFDVSLDINSECTVINSKKINNLNVIEQYNSFMDCNIIASDKFKVINNNIDGIEVNVFYIIESHKSIAERMFEYIDKILSSYRIFGDIKKDSISLVILPRRNGGGYCREGLIVLDSSGDLQDELQCYKYIAHELSHLWWWKVKKCDSWEDWLNESFAEFSALYSLKESYGEQVFYDRINDYKKRADGLPAIKGINRDDEKAFPVLYIKGPVVLNEIMNFIGEDKFYKFLNQVHLNNVNTTELLLKILNEIAGEKATDKLKNMLIE